MIEKSDQTIARTGKTERAAWQRPELTRMQAEEAEISVAGGGTDGAAYS